MNEKINKLSRGIIEDRMPAVTITPERLEGTISQGTVSKADFGLVTEDRFFLRGLIYSDCPEVIPQSPYFSGSNTHVAFNVDATKSEVGDELSGQFRLVTSAGEFVVPFSYTVLRNRELAGPGTEWETVTLDGGDLLRELALEKKNQPRKTAGTEAEEDNETDKDFYLKLVDQYREDSGIYQSFEHQMRGFVRDNILAGSIDDKLIRLYLKVLKPEMIDVNMARALTDILLTCKIEVPSRFRKLCIKYAEIEEEQTVGLEFGQATFPVYTNEYSLALIDATGNRYELKNFRLSPIMADNTALLNICAKSAPEIATYRIRFAHKLAAQSRLDRDGMMLLYDLSSSDGISRQFASKLVKSIIKNYDWKEHQNDAFVLVSIGTGNFDRDVWPDYVQALIDLGFLKDAAQFIFTCDYDCFTPADLRKVCEYILSANKPAEDDKIIYLCKYLFDKGVARDDILEYLCKYYNGSTGDMYEILVASDEDGLELSDLPERLLGQMLFVAKYENMDRVFRIYARGNVTRRLLKAYYCVKCHGYFIRGEELDSEIFSAIKNILAGELVSGDIPLIVSLAVCKYFSSNTDKLSREDVAIIRQVIDRLCRKDIVLPFFKKFAGVVDLPVEILDRTYICYYGQPEDSVTLILYGENDDEEPVYFEMNAIYDGIFAKSVLIYDCEHFSYEIRVLRNGESTICEEGELTGDISDADSSRKFTKLNRLLSGSASPDNEKWQKAMDDYANEDSLCSMLFKID